MEQLKEAKMEILGTLRSASKLWRMYENLNLQKYALSLVPTEELNMNATLKLSVLENSDNSVALEDLVIVELLNWFKLSFFSWVDIPKCETCNQVTIKKGFTPPLETEIMWGATKVELYFCSFCQQYVRFPRYNHPRKLLETRKGRCGEWSNCFTLLCHALGYDARLVYGLNDHAWTEFFSLSKNRWIHCDPSENICDKPLLYERGWKKHITNVVAVSKDEVQDVTWRYTSNFQEALKRRAFGEEWLLHIITTLTEKLQSNITIERRKELVLRRALELTEFLTPPSTTEELSGRTSGSIDWRTARGEICLYQSEYIFTLSEKEILQKHFYVKYNCATDKYVRVSSEETLTSWMTCAFEYSNIFRKVETDWKQVYLSCSEGSPHGKISWKFSFENTGLVVHTLKLHLNSRIFENGKIVWTVSSSAGRKHTENFKEGTVKISTRDFQGSSCLNISAELTGGNSWQHAQLFRQELDSVEFPFEVEIHLCAI